MKDENGHNEDENTNPGPILTPRDTAVVAIEFQRTWTEKGFFHRLIKKEYEERNVLRNTKDLLNASRAYGYRVIQAPFILDRSDKERYRKIPFPPKLFRGFSKGTWKAEFTEGISRDTDLIVHGRCGFDACECSDLQEILEKNHIKNVFLCGFTTDHCVSETMGSLSSKGYHCIMVADCTATRNNDIQRRIESSSDCMNTKEVVDLMKK